MGSEPNARVQAGPFISVPAWQQAADNTCLSVSPVRRIRCSAMFATFSHVVSSASLDMLIKNLFVGQTKFVPQYLQ